MPRLLLLAFAALALLLPPAHAGEKPLRIAPFEADVTPPLGTPLCDALVQPAKKIDDPLLARGLILFGDGPPVVVCALDWVGVGNTGHDAFREALAKAVGTTTDRVAVHCLHQHDAPGLDFLAYELLKPHGLETKLYNVEFGRAAIRRVADAAAKAAKNPRPVTHIAVGKAKVEQVASNRRVLGPNGKVKFTRTSATRNAEARAEPEGVIDPYVHLISFWDGDTPRAALTYYATHPMSYYGRGGVSSDFAGLARGLRDKDVPAALHIYFNGAGGNVTAGKYNDGSPENRPLLAQRLADGMKEAFASATKQPVKASDVEWRTTAVALPLSKQYKDTQALKDRIADAKLPLLDRIRAARNLAWATRCRQGHKVEIACLKLGPAYILHMPGELFIEYQLAAQKLRPGSPVMMAAYGDYGPGYIGTAIAYTQGGYETGAVSRVAPEVEGVLTAAMRELLK